MPASHAAWSASHDDRAAKTVRKSAHRIYIVAGNEPIVGFVFAYAIASHFAVDREDGLRQIARWQKWRMHSDSNRWYHISDATTIQRCFRIVLTNLPDEVKRSDGSG